MTGPELADLIDAHGALSDVGASCFRVTDKEVREVLEEHLEEPVDDPGYF